MTMTTNDAAPDDLEDQPADTTPPSEPPATGREVPELDTGHALSLVSNAEAAEVSLFPEQSELVALAALAVTLSASGLVPKDLRGKPNDVLVVLLTARELRIDYMTALRECAPVNGKVTLSPKLRVAMVIERGLGDIWYAPDNNAARATVFGQRAGSERVDAYTFTWDDAVEAGLADSRCEPNDAGTRIVHWKATSGNDRLCKCDMYRKYGRNMLKWRAAGYLIDEVFPHAATGLYSAEELGAIVDEDGRAVLDVNATEALPGMKRGGRAIGTGGGAGDDEEPPISADDLADLERRIPALPEGGVAALRALWSRSLPKPENLLARQVKTARAMVESVEKRAEAGEWGEWRNWAGGETVDRPQAEDIVRDGRSPHEAMRERLAREAAAGDAGQPETAPVLPLDVPGAPDPLPNPPEEHTDENGGQSVPPDAKGDGVTTCLACGKEFRTTASGKNHPGPEGRDKDQPGYHGGCAPF